MKIKRKLFTGLVLLQLIILVSAFTTVKEPKRNLQVLPKDISEELLDKIMDGYCSSLNVECSYCHTEGDMQDDSKPEKRIARQMISMTNEINERYFGKNSGTVSCMTCHNGKVHP